MLDRLFWHTPLQKCRSLLKLVMYFKIINQLVDIPATQYLKETRCSSRKHNHCYQQSHARIEAHANSFFPSTIKLWNNLTDGQVNMTTVKAFTDTLDL